MRSYRTGIVAALMAAGFASVSMGQTPIPNPIGPTIEKSDITIDLQVVASGLNAPVHLTGAGDGSGRLFVADQNGKVRIIQNGTLLGDAFLDIAVAGVLGSDTFSVGGERGLLGIAFHPDYEVVGSAGFGKFYTYQSVARTTSTDFDDGLVNTGVAPPGQSLTSHQSLLVEWSVDPTDSNRIDPNSRRVVMRIDQPQTNHNGGQIDFGPDGYLYMTLGDGGSQDDGNTVPNSNSGHGDHGNAQNKNAILGKVLRIDPLHPTAKPGSSDLVSANGQYRNPANNPFAGVTSGLDEIFALGLRNPFRISFDEPTQTLIIADVGQFKIEEVNQISYVDGGGSNFGWRIKEGTFNFDPNGTGNGFVYDDAPPIDPEGIAGTLVDPVLQYDHDDGVAVIGGYIYRGDDIPFLEGLYIFGDYDGNNSATPPQGRLFVSDLASGIIKELRIGEEDLPLGLFVKGMGRDDNGELYVMVSSQITYQANGTTGMVLMIIPEPTTIALLGLAGVGLLRRRLRR